MRRGDSSYFIISLPLLVLTALCCMWLFLNDKYMLACIALFIALVLFISCIRLFYSARRKTTFMFNALENNDFTFRFQEDFHSNSDRLFNSTLNRIKDILAKAKVDAEEREKYYELIMNCVDTAIIVIDTMGRVYQTNNEALRLMGVPTLTHVSQLRVLGQNVVNSLQQSCPGDRFQLSFNNERGTVTLAIAVSSMRLTNKDLRIIAANDINSSLDEKEIESWSRLIRVLTHEIMNSITPITSLSDTLIKINEGGNEQISQGLEVIGSTSRSLIAFVDSYRRLTRIPTPQKHPFYVKPFLERQMQLVLGANGENVTYSLTIADEELLLYGDEDLLGQVVINLLKNGMQAAIAHAQLPNPTAEADTLVSREARITVNAYTNPAQEILIEISDNGGGIPAEIVQNMFVPFFTTKENGSGIGLSLSRQIMRLHNATLQLTSNTPTRTTFTLCF